MTLKCLLTIAPTATLHLALPQHRRHLLLFPSARQPRKLDSPRIPLAISPGPYTASLSPLVDPASPLSLPESDADRVRWLNRFTPRWNETREDRLARFNQRAENMRTRKAHTERLLNSFQRSDALTKTVLPSDLMISLSFARWHASGPGTSPATTKAKQKVSDQGPGTYVVPNRILHPYWVAKREGLSVWMLCHRDALKQPKRLVGVYRYVREPKYSPHLADQISSQLARRIAQECVVLNQALRPLPPTVSTRLQDITTARSRSSLMFNYPIVASGEDLVKYVQGLLSLPPRCTATDGRIKEAHGYPPGTLGGIVVMSSQLFTQLLNCNSPESDVSSDTPTKIAPSVAAGERMLMFSLALCGGPVPVWDLEGLLSTMAKQSPRQPEGRLVTAATRRTSLISATSPLVDVLTAEITAALHFSTCSAPSKAAGSGREEAYLVPLSEATYPLLLSLRRATWWLGQGFEPEHFDELHSMSDEADERKKQRLNAWQEWIVNRNTVTGQIRRNGELWVPTTGRGKSRQRWKRV